MKNSLRSRLSSRALSMLVIVTLMSFGVSAAFAEESGGGAPLPPLVGSGTLEVPYEISTCEDLQRINENPNADYVLTTNIDCTQSSQLNNGQGFLPITSFNASYIDGRNFAIDGLTISGSSDTSFGFIKQLGATSSIRNIRFTNFTVVNTNTDNPASKITGGLVAVNKGTIENVYLWGSVTSAGFVGGVSGTNEGTISSATVAMQVNGTSAATHTLGSVAGYSIGTVTNIDSHNAPQSYEATEATCGGLIGFMNGGSLTNSIVQGTISCNGDSNSVGGLVGYATSTATIANNATLVEPNWAVPLDGSIVGYNATAIDVSSNVHDLSKVIAPDCDGTGNTNCIGVNENNSDPNYFINNSTNAPFNNWNFSNDWEVQEENTPWLNYDKPIAHLSLGNLNTSSTADSITLTWASPRILNANWQPDVTGYEVISAQDYTQSTMTAQWNVIATLPNDQFTFTVSNLDLYTGYSFRVRAINEAGAGIPTYPVSVKPVPQKLSTPTATQSISRAIMIAWEDANSVATSYTVQYKKSSESTWKNYTRTNFPDPSSAVYPLDQSTSYDFRVAASNERGIGEYSDIFTTATPSQTSYTVGTCQDLQDISQDPFGTYVLSNDIDCSESVDWNEGEGFEPIGILADNTSFPFAGVLDGAGHKIENIYMNRPGQMAALFGAIDGAVIKNLTLDGGQIAGVRTNEGNAFTDQVVNPIVASLAVFASNSNIDNVDSNINLLGDPLNGQNGGAGGLVGLVIPSVFGPGTDVTEMSITNSSHTGAVDAFVSGGLVAGSFLLDLLPLITTALSGEDGVEDYLPFLGTGMSLTISNTTSSGNVTCDFICSGAVGLSVGDLNLDGITRQGNTGEFSYSNPESLESTEDILAMIAMAGPISGGLVGVNLPLSLDSGSPKLNVTNSSVEGNVLGTISSGIVGVNLPAISIDLVSLLETIDSPDAGTITNIVFDSLSRLFSNDALVATNTEVSADVMCTVACGGVSAISLGKTSLTGIEISGDVTNNNAMLVELNHPFSVFPIQITGGLMGLQLLFPLEITSSTITGDVSVNQAGDAPELSFYELMESLLTGSEFGDPELIQLIGALVANIEGTGGAVGSFISPLNITGLVEPILGVPTGTLDPFALTISNTTNSGEVFSSAQSATGGLVGTIFGKSTISSSSTSGTITNTTFAEMFRTPISSAATGGLVGKMLGGWEISGQIIPLIMAIIGWTSTDGPEFSFEDMAAAYEPLRVSMGYATIVGSHATGDVISSNSAGGLVGNVGGISKIQKSYATGDVYGTAAGGLIGSGFNMGSMLGVLNIFGTIDLENTYARGNVYTSDDENTVTFGGGLVGMMAHFGEFNISNSYSTGSVEVEGGSNNTRLVAGGLVGADLDMSVLPYGLMTAFGADPVTRGIIDQVLPALDLELKTGTSISNSFTTSSVPTKSSGQDKLLEEIALGNPSNYKTTGSIFGFFFGLDTENFPEFPYPAEGEEMDNEALAEFISSIRWVSAGDVVDNTFYDKSKNSNTVCGSTLPSIEEWLFDILSQTNDPENPATGEEILALIPKLKTDSNSECTPVNTNGSQNNLFKNNKTVAPLNTWNFNASYSDTSGIWYSHANDFPTFKAGPITPVVNPPTDPVTPNNPNPSNDPFIPVTPVTPDDVETVISQLPPIIPEKPITEVLDNVIEKVDAEVTGEAKDQVKEDTGFWSAVVGLMSATGAFLLRNIFMAILIIALGAGITFLAKKKKVMDKLHKPQL